MTALCFGFLLRVKEGFRVRVMFRVRAEFRVRVGLRVWVAFRVRVGFRVRALKRNKRHESGYALVKDVCLFWVFVHVVYFTYCLFYMYILHIVYFT